MKQSRCSSALQRRVVARVDRLRQKPFLVIGPELADIGIGLDRRVDQLAVLLLAAADIDVADDITEMVEMEGPARAVGQRDGTKRRDQLGLVVGLAAGFFERRLGDHALYNRAGGVKA